MYIMTSEATREPTLDFLRENDYFGLSADQLTIFEQRVIPALDSQVRANKRMQAAQYNSYLGKIHHGNQVEAGEVARW